MKLYLSRWFLYCVMDRKKDCQDTLLHNGRRLVKILYCVMDEGFSSYLFCNGWRIYCVMGEGLSSYFIVFCNGRRIVKILYCVIMDEGLSTSRYPLLCNGPDKAWARACQDTLLCNVWRLVNIHYCLMDECFSRYVILQWMKACQDTLLCNGGRLYQGTLLCNGWRLAKKLQEWLLVNILS